MDSVMCRPAYRRYGPMDYTDPKDSNDDDTDIDVQAAAAATASNKEVNGQRQRQHHHQWQERVLAFQTLLVRVVQTSISQPDQVPSLVGQHMDLILSILQPRHPYDMDGSAGLEFELESVLSEVIPNTFQLLKKERDTAATTTTSTTTDNYDADDADEVLQQQIMDSLEFMFDFAESFVEELKTMDDANKQLLGKILHAATRTTPPPTTTTSTMSSVSEIQTQPNQQDDDVSTTTSLLLSREDEFDDLMDQCRGQLTPGFLRHLEGECERIANAPQTTPESLRMLQFLRTLQLRVVEELGMTHLGQEAIVLGQLLGYDDPQERLAVLQTGLSLRGIEFAQTMASLTEQALADMTRITANAKRDDSNGTDTDSDTMTDTGVDPELMERVSGIHDAIQKFLLQQQEQELPK